MNLKHLAHGQLVTSLKSLVSEERRVGIEILSHLREVERRRLYADLGYSSLWMFCMQELKYSEGAAQRRILAMRALAELPEIETSIKEGKLSLTTVAQVQSFSKQMPCSKEEKLKLLKSIEGKSRKQTERLLADLNPKATKPEQERVLSSELTEIRFTADKELYDDLEKIKDLAAHVLGMNPTYQELLKFMAKLTLKKLQPKEKSPPPAAVKVNKHTRYIPAHIRREVFRRADNRCQICSEKRGLQIDHIHPYALGGPNSLENLRLLCHTHNRQHALKTYGERAIPRAYLIESPRLVCLK